jgi:hypothetical protein
MVPRRSNGGVAVFHTQALRQPTKALMYVMRNTQADRQSEMRSVANRIACRITSHSPKIIIIIITAKNKVLGKLAYHDCLGFCFSLFGLCRLSHTMPVIHNSELRFGMRSPSLSFPPLPCTSLPLSSASTISFSLQAVDAIANTQTFFSLTLTVGGAQRSESLPS